ncbi:MAG: cell division protein CrgA [Actinobacteria bacterium]|nr:cell division protein CrgA [Actinomycetota bacterium]
MPESKVRKAAADKKKQTAKDERAAERAKQQKAVAPGSRQWVLPAFITLGLLGVLWLVVYYITTAVGIAVPVMSDIEGIWNVVIGMVALAGAFILATFWK